MSSFDVLLHTNLATRTPSSGLFVQELHAAQVSIRHMAIPTCDALFCVRFHHPTPSDPSTGYVLLHQIHTWTTLTSL